MSKGVVPLEDLRRTPLGSIDPARAAQVALADAPRDADHGRTASSLFGSAL
ncbi:hypothetical protein [Actinoplanes awajinensis]|uniref:hypothetical protein n=1 Tax=Actinoplanes awajinensis TaxID=135946 RepID=UPI0018DD40CE|nr:hypothetical protein [Actinoplanes awajinensis]